MSICVEIGLRAGSSESYTEFSGVFDEAIHLYHGVNVTSNYIFPDDISEIKDLQSTSVVDESMKVKLLLHF